MFFWAIGTYRKNYFVFGVVVLFDTAYRTINYSKICASFTGINHHRQCVTFGAGFLAYEKIDSFIWLFDKFLEAMEGYEPTLIIIDQHLTTKVAIDKIFNSYAHRFCMRHIMKKNSEKVGVSLNVNKKFYNHFKSCVWGLETQNDFESTWKAIMVRFKLEKNDWLSHMYDIQSMLIPTYFKDIFLLGYLEQHHDQKVRILSLVMF